MRDWRWRVDWPLVRIDGTENVGPFTKEGAYYLTCESEYDLVLMPRKVTFWYNAYDTESGFCDNHPTPTLKSSRDQAERVALMNNGYIETRSVEIEI